MPQINITVSSGDGGKIELPFDAYCRDDLYNILIMNGYTVQLSADDEKKIVSFIFWKEF